MIPEELVYLKINQGIASIYINQPDKRNAINIEMWHELIKLVEECNQNDEVKVIVFRSTTSHAFSAGADISEFNRARGTVETASDYNQLLVLLEEKIMLSSKPSIAMIQGYCLGAGCTIAIACDFRFTDGSGKFGITPAKLGIIYPFESTKNLVDLVGPTHAKDILFTGRIMEAEEAYRIGLVNRISESGLLEKETYEFAKRLTENDPLSITGAKKIIYEILQGATSASSEITSLINESMESEEYRQRVRAFVNKSKK